MMWFGWLLLGILIGYVLGGLHAWAALVKP